MSGLFGYYRSAFHDRRQEGIIPMSSLIYEQAPSDGTGEGSGGQSSKRFAENNAED